MDREAEKRKLVKALEACLQTADGLGLPLVGIHVSYAIDLLCAEDVMVNIPPTKVG
jgi:hypothetical protein